MAVAIFCRAAHQRALALGSACICIVVGLRIWYFTAIKGRSLFIA